MESKNSTVRVIKYPIGADQIGDLLKKLGCEFDTENLTLRGKLKATAGNTRSEQLPGSSYPI